MRYYPYDFMASRLYHTIFCDAIDETSDWGVLDTRDMPEWALLRLKECDLIGSACMVANIEKTLAYAGNRVLAESPTGRNHFYNLWMAAHHNPSEVDLDYDAWLNKEICTDEYLERMHKKKPTHEVLADEDFTVTGVTVKEIDSDGNLGEDILKDSDTDLDWSFKKEYLGNWEAKDEN